MALAQLEVDHGESPQTLQTPTWRNRPIAMTFFVVFTAIAWYFLGLPTDPIYAYLNMWLAAVCWRIARPVKTHIRFGIDWLPIVILLVLYNSSRGFADEFSDPHVTEMIYFDRWLTGGPLPTTWLQEHLWHGSGDIRWWDVIASLVYFSHFVVCLGVAAMLWLRNRHTWAAFMRRWLTLIAAGLTTYFLYPAAPPWWASKYGYFDEPLRRISAKGWNALGLHTAGNLLNVAQQNAGNEVAAMPSLHSAFAMLVVLFFLPRVRKYWWPLLLCYPVAMGFTLVYSGEHYIIDVFVGWSYVFASFIVVSLAERWWKRRSKTATNPA